MDPTEDFNFYIDELNDEFRQDYENEFNAHRYLLDRREEAIVVDPSKTIKLLFNQHESFIPSEETEQVVITEELLERYAFNIIRYNHLVKFRMDVALEKRIRGKINNYFAFDLEDVKMLEGCIEYYEAILRNIELMQDEKLIEIVKRNMVYVYGMLGKIYYYLWEDDQSNNSFQFCKKILDELVEKNNGIVYADHKEWIFECLLSNIIRELNASAKSESLITLINNYVDTFGDATTKDFVNLSDDDFCKTISKNTNCDMQSIKEYLQFSKIKYFKSILNDDNVISIISNSIEFVKLQKSHALSLPELEFHFGMDEFYSRLGAILTNLGNPTAASNYNHSLQIRKNFFMRTLMNRIIDYQNSGLHEQTNEKILIIALYYYLFAMLEGFKFNPLPSILISKEPFIFINYVSVALYKEIENNFPIDRYDEFSMNFKLSAETMDKTNLVIYKNCCLALLRKTFANDKLVEEDLKTIEMLETQNEEEKYLSLQIPSINRADLCDVMLFFYE